MRAPLDVKRCAVALHLISMLAAGLTLAACALPTPATGLAAPTVEKMVPAGVDVAAASPLASSTWVLASLNGQPPLPGSHLTLTFDQSEFSGFGGCNRFGGEYSIDGDRLEPGDMEQTLEGCVEPGVLDQERAYVEALHAGGQYRLYGDRLEILDQAGQVRLSFTRTAEGPPQDVAALLGNHWQLVSVNEVPPIEGSIITLAFEATGKKDDGTTVGRAFGSAGCRPYEADFEADGRRVWFPMLKMLSEVCASDQLLHQEGEYTTMLGWLGRYRIDGDQLELQTQRGEVLRFTKMPSGATQLTPSTPLATPPAPAG